MFWKSSTEKKLETMHKVIHHSFSKVRSDIYSMTQWVNYLYQKSLEQEQLMMQQQMTIRSLAEHISAEARGPEDIKKIIESNYPYEKLLSQISHLNLRIDELSAKLNSIHIGQAEPTKQLEQNLAEMEKRLEKMEGKKLSIKEKIMKRLTKNSKEYVINVVLGYIRKYESILATKLKEIVVDEQAFCSKSSFYRILEDIESLDEVGVVKKGKEKQYFYKIINK